MQKKSTKTIQPIRPLAQRAKQLYPNSKSMRKQWILWTQHLYRTGRHALLTGGFNRQSI